MGEICYLTVNPSYSKNKKYIDDIERINSLYYFAYNKYLDLSLGDNPYYHRFSERADNKDYVEYLMAIHSLRKCYLEASKSYLKILEDNTYFNIDKVCRKTYTDTQARELLLDFFNDEGADKYKIVKSLFDEERVGTAPMNDLDFCGFCTILSSDIMPYVLQKETRTN